MGEKTEIKCNYDVVNKYEKPGFGIRHLQCVVMCLCVTTLYIIRSSMGVAILAMTDQKQINNTNIDIFNWDKQIQGVVLSSFFWGYMVMQVPGGVIAKRFGGKPILLAALIINGALCLAVPLLAKVGGWHAVCAVRMFMGLSQSCLFPSCHTLLGKWIPPEERTRLSNLVYAGVQLGTIISMPVCGLLSRTSLGWKTIFYSMGGLAFLFALLWFALAASSPAEHRLIGEKERTYIEKSLSSHGNQKSMSIPWKTLFTSIPLIALCCTHIGVNWVFIVFFVEIPTYMKNVLHVNLQDSGMLSALPFIAMWIFGIVFSFICDYTFNKGILSLTASRKLFNSIGCVGVGIGLVVLSFLTSDHPYLAIAVLTTTVGILSAAVSSGFMVIFVRNNKLYSFIIFLGTFGVAIGMVILSFVTAEHPLLSVTILTLTVGVMSAAGPGFMLNHLDLSPTYAGVMFGVTNCVSNVIGALAPLLIGYILGEHSMELSRWRIVFFTSAALIVITNIIFVVFGTSKRQPWDDPAHRTSKQELETFKTAALKAETLYKFEDQ